MLSMFDPSLLDLVPCDLGRKAITGSVGKSKCIRPIKSPTNCWKKCNSAELASILRSMRQFSEIQSAVHQFREDAKKRILIDLNKTMLNPDVNGIIVSLCG